MTRRKAAARWQLFASGLAFGLMAALVRLVSRDASGFTGPQMSTLRFAVGTAAMLALFRARPGTFRPVRRRLLVTRGILGGLAAVLFFVSLARIPAAEATMINNTFPIIGTVLSIYALGERPTVQLGGALVVLALAVVLVVGPGSPAAGFGLGELAAVAGAVVAGTSVISIRALRATDNAPTIFFAFCVGGLLVSAPFAVGPWPGGAAVWAIAIFAAFVATAGQLLMTAAYGALTVPEAALWQQLTPVAAYLWAIVLLGEHLSPIGAIAVLVGVAAVAYGTAFGQRRPAGSAYPRAGAAERAPAVGVAGDAGGEVR